MPEVKRKRGRPKGSKNKVNKSESPETIVTDADTLVVAAKKKVKKSKTPLDTLTGEVVIVSGPPDPAERERNAAIQVAKNVRPGFNQVTCENGGCKNGIDGKPFVGVESLFSSYGGKLVCSECLRKLFGT